MTDTGKQGSAPAASGAESSGESSQESGARVGPGESEELSNPLPFPNYADTKRRRFPRSPLEMWKRLRKGSGSRLKKGDPPERVPSESLSMRPSVCICLLRVTYETHRKATATGFLIGPSMIATSAHVLHHPDPTLGLAHEIVVTPGYLQPDGHRVSQIVGRSAFRWNQNWGPPDDFVAEHDYGLIALPDPPPFASFGHLTLHVPGEDDLARHDLKICGYPGAGPGGQLAQWRHIGELVDEPGQRTLLHNVMTQEGQSGSPMYFIANGQVLVLGIHSKASVQTAGANVARRVTEEMIADYARWAEQFGASGPLIS